MDNEMRAALEAVRAEEAQHAQSTALAMLRNLLAGALCAGCGDPLGDEGEVVQDSEGRTMHESCVDEDSGTV